MSDTDAVFAAVTEGDLTGLEALLTRDPGLAWSRRADGLSLLMLACYHRQQRAVDAVLHQGVTPDLFEAAALGETERLREILDADPGAIGAYSADGWTALHLAAFFGRDAAVRELLSRGSAVSARSRKPLENTPLNAAAAGNHLEVCRVLLDAGADPNARQSGGFVPLHAAAQNGSRDLVELLLERGADRGLTTDDGRSSLDLARAAGWEALTEILEP